MNDKKTNKQTNKKKYIYILAQELMKLVFFFENKLHYHNEKLKNWASYII